MIYVFIYDILLIFIYNNCSLSAKLISPSGTINRLSHERHTFLIFLWGYSFNLKLFAKVPVHAKHLHIRSMLESFCKFCIFKSILAGFYVELRDSRDNTSLCLKRVIFSNV